MGVILGQFHAQAPRLHSDSGVALRIESTGTAQYLGGDLVLLKGDAGMIEGMFGEIAKQFTSDSEPAEAMTINKLIYLLEALLPPERRNCALKPCDRGGNDRCILLQRKHFTPCNGIKPNET